MRFGFGFGLSHHRGSPPSPSAQDTICEAIKYRKHVVATIDGGHVLLEPYAVFRDGSGVSLDAVVVLRECVRVRGWRPSTFDVAALTNVKLHDAGFIPHGAFRADAPIYRDPICIVEPVQSFEDALKTEASAG